MARHKEFRREEVLEKALRVFWEKGFADASLHNLEEATGVNKSGLYSEFKDKQDLFLESLRYYLAHRGGAELLARQPLGLKNVRDFLEIGNSCEDGQRGCFSVNTLRELSILPPEAQKIILQKNKKLKKLISQNIAAERPQANAEMLAELAHTFFSGLSIEQNLTPSKSVTSRKVSEFMRLLEA